MYSAVDITDIAQYMNKSSEKHNVNYDKFGH